MFCNKCGHEVPDNTPFCENCGNKLSPDKETVQVHCTYETIKPPINTSTRVGLRLGILATVFGWIEPIGAVLCFFLGPLALKFAVEGYKEIRTSGERGKKRAIIGMILGLWGIRQGLRMAIAMLMG